jgi:tetratricopeptide (TPR) repeat protein
LVDRFLALNPDADRAVELRVLRAFAFDDGEGEAQVLTDLRRASDPSLLVTVGYVPVLLHDLEAGAILAGLLTEDSRTPEMRALGHVYRAYLFTAQGSLTDARGELAAAELFDAYREAEHGAFLTVLPFIPADDAEVHAKRREIQALVPEEVPPVVHPSGYIRGHDGVHRHVKAFLLGLLNARLGDYAAAERYAAVLGSLASPEKSPSLSEDLSLGVRADFAGRRGESADGIALLERARIQTYYQNTVASPVYSISFQRYLRAMLLEEVGRLEEAILWYGSVEQISMYDLVFLAPAHLRRAEIYERRGQLDRAAGHYQRFVELWSNCDPELRPLVDHAEQRLSELAGNS